MLRYVLKRILIFLPTLFIISLFTFFISVNAPGDPIEKMLNVRTDDGSLTNKLSDLRAYDKKRKDLGFDLPQFYFSLMSMSSCDTVYKISNKFKRNAFNRICHEYGEWENVANYYKQLAAIEKKLIEKLELNADNKELEKCYNLISNIESIYAKEELLQKIKKLENDLKYEGVSDISLMPITKKMFNEKNNWKKYIPKLVFYGKRNQYHNWMISFMKGDFGVSYIDKRKVSDKIWSAIWWTFPISFLSICLTYFVAIPIGIWTAVNRNKPLDRIVGLFLFVLYSLPSFWVATIIIILLGNPESFFYAEWFNPLGLKSLYSEVGLYERLMMGLKNIWLPVLCLTYFNFAFLAKQMRGSMIGVLTQDYIRTARAKGLSFKNIIWKHGFRNSLLPVITMLAGLFPLAIGGSIVLEIIFSIPGMGWLTLEAFYSRDYPVIFTVVMFSAILTLIGFLISDILYTIADPRIIYSSKTNYGD